MGWLPYVVLAILAGVVNAINAWQQLAFDCRYLVYFRPSRVWGVYLGTAAQLGFPVAVAWKFLKFAERPPFDLILVLKTVVLGVAFVALMNATTNVAGFDFDQLRQAYNWFVYVAKRSIAARETARTAAFWQEFQREIAEAPSLTAGLAYLRSYIEADISLSPEGRTATLAGIDKVAAVRDRAKQAARVKALLAVRRSDLPIVLGRFGCSQTLVALIGARA